MKTELDKIFTALGDPIRRALLTRLLKGDATISVLHEKYQISIVALSKHVAALEQAGLVSTQKQGRSRWVRLEFDGLREAQIWLETLNDASLDWDELEAAIDDLEQP